MEITVSTSTARVPVTIMHIRGDIDSVTYQEFETLANNLVTSGARHILVDLTESRFVSSAGLRALHRLFTALGKFDSELQTGDALTTGRFTNGMKKSPHLKLHNLSAETKTAFNLSGFHLFIETFNDKQTAIASF